MPTSWKRLPRRVVQCLPQSRDVYVYRMVSAPGGGRSPQRPSISTSRCTGRFACSSRIASSARCFGASDVDDMRVDKGLERAKQTTVDHSPLPGTVKHVQAPIGLPAADCPAPV